MKPKTLDHVALWTDGRDAIADFTTRHLGMHVIDRTEKFTLVGSDARHGKLTLFEAEAPREPAPLRHVAFRVRDLAAASQALPPEARAEERDGGVYLDAPGGLRLGLVEAPTAVEYDLDHVALLSPDPAAAAEAYAPLGFAPAASGAEGGPRVEVGGAFVEFHAGAADDGGRPLLNHLAVLVDSAGDHLERAEELGLEVADVVDAANTYAVFVWGPDRVKIEYVEHKPSFSLV